MDINTIMKILDEKADGNILFSYIESNEITKAVQYIVNLCDCDEILAKAALINVKTDYYDEIFKPNTDLSPEEIAYNNAQAQEWLNKPKCPICQSTNLSKITMTKKVAKIAAFGIFGMGDNGKTWKCNNCGSKF